MNTRLTIITLFATIANVLAVIKVTDRWMANDTLIPIQTLRDTCAGGTLKSVYIYDSISEEEKSSCNPALNILKSLLPKYVMDCYIMPKECPNGIKWNRTRLDYRCNSTDKDTMLKSKAQILVVAVCERPEYANQKEEEINVKSDDVINIPLCSDGKKAQAIYALHTTTCVKPPELASQMRTDLPKLLTDINECRTKNCTGLDLRGIHPDDEYRCVDEQGRNLPADDIKENLYITWGCPDTTVILELLASSSTTPSTDENKSTDVESVPGAQDEMTASSDAFLIPLIVVCVALALLIIAFITTIVCFLKYQGKQRDVIYSLEEAKPVSPPPSKSDLYTKVNKSLKRKDIPEQTANESQTDEYLLPENEQRKNRESVANEYSKTKGHSSLLDDDDMYELPQLSQATSNPNLLGRTLPETPQYESVNEKA